MTDGLTGCERKKEKQEMKTKIFIHFLYYKCSHLMGSSLLEKLHILEYILEQF